jgi:cytochrome P450
MGSTIYHTNDPQLATIVFGETDFFSKRIIEGHPLYPIKNKEAGVFFGDTDTEEWKEVHKLLPPALGPKAMRHYAPTMQKTVEDAFRVFDELDERDEAWNVYLYMLKLGAQAVGKLVLGMDFQHFTSPDARPHAMVMRIAQSLELNKKITSMGSWYKNLPFGGPQRLRKARAHMEAMMRESVKNASKGVGDLSFRMPLLRSRTWLITSSAPATARVTSYPVSESWSRLLSPLAPVSLQPVLFCLGFCTVLLRSLACRRGFCRRWWITVLMRTLRSLPN